MTRRLVRDLMSDGLPEQPPVIGISQCPRRETMTDIDPPVANAHAENILPRKLGEKEPILQKILPVLADPDDVRRFTSDYILGSMI